MSQLIGPHQQTVEVIKRYTKELDAENDQVTSFLDAQAHGEPVDADKFVKLLQQHMVTQQAMEGEVQLHTKQQQMVMNEAK